MSKSEHLYQQALNEMPGGVNSPVRAFRSVGGSPLFIHHAKGAYIYDEDGKGYVDYVGSWGPMILGHAHPEVLKAVNTAVECGLSFGAPTKSEILLAQKVKSLMPSIEKIRMCNSGTEATMTALRLARGYTQRDIIVKFEGCYHGHSDSLLIKAGSGALTFGHPSSPGVPKAIAELTMNLAYNDIELLTQTFEAYGDKIAGVIIEPVAGNMGCVVPDVQFLTALRSLCTKHKSLLIMDEVMTGFRVALGGAQAYFDIEPDLTTLGKVIGGGMPVGALGGKAAIMDYLSPIGPVYQAGTLSGNPITMAAGLKTLELISDPGFHEQITQKTQYLVDGLKKAAHNAQQSMVFNAAGGMFGFFFNDIDKEIKSFAQVLNSSTDKFNTFFHGMLEESIYFAPSAFEAAFMSIAHTKEDLDKTIESFERVLKNL